MTQARFMWGLMAVALPAIGATVAATVTSSATPYPLDAYERTGIRRLQVYQRTLRLQPGAMLPDSAIHLRLSGVNETFDIGPDTPKDPALQRGLERIVGARHPSYRIAVVDLTDPINPRYAAIRGDEGYIPGSVGKILVMAGLFNELRELHPNDIDARRRLLRNTMITADEFVIPNSHQIPVVNDDLTAATHRSVRVGDEFSLWEWVDHMISPSSNAAGAMVWKHVMLLDRFGGRYPVPVPEQAQWLLETPKPDLTAQSIRVLEEPMVAVGLDTAHLRIRTLFTATGSRRIPGRASFSTPNQLVRWLIKLEQGQLVDQWSSLEMKKLLYFTRRRYRYAAASALNSAAVYFKSGSLYRCRPEPDYVCGQYRGNAENLMHSVAIIEAPATPEPGQQQRVYVLSMMSNVLKVNSASEHAEIGSAIDRLIASLHP